ncbi:hypothetical protein AOLI_G00229980 [Acnodon oligacanthus]
MKILQKLTDKLYNSSILWAGPAGSTHFLVRRKRRGGRLALAQLTAASVYRQFSESGKILKRSYGVLLKLIMYYFCCCSIQNLEN